MADGEAQWALLLALGALATGMAVWRLLTQRFPHPCDIATLSILYYTMPLSAVALWLQDAGGEVVFLHAAAGTPAVARQSAAYAVLAVASLALGRWLSTRVRESASEIRFPLVRADARKARLFVALLLAQMALGVMLFGPQAILAGYAVESQEGTAALGNALIYASIELIGLSIAYAYLVRRATPQRGGLKLLVFAAAAMVTLAVVRGKRLEVISAFLPLAVLVFATRPYFRRPAGRLFTLAAVAGGISLLASLRLGEPPNLPSFLFNLLSEGLYAGHALPGIIEKLALRELDYEHGRRLGAALLAFIPRFLWPEKDDVLYAGNQALEGVSPLGATTLLAEIVLQGGVVAVALAFLAMGWAFQRLYGSQQQLARASEQGRLTLRMMGYLVAVAIFIPHFRDGLIPAVKISLQSFAFFLVLAGFQWRPRPTWRFSLGWSRRRDVGASPAAASAPPLAG